MTMPVQQRTRNTPLTRFVLVTILAATLAAFALPVLARARQSGAESPARQILRSLHAGAVDHHGNYNYSAQDDPYIPQPIGARGN